MKRISFFLAAALMALTFTACNPSTELEGYNWTCTTSGTDIDGDIQIDNYSLIFTDDEHGTLFVSNCYEGDKPDEMMGTYGKFSYTLDDNAGSITLTCNFYDDKKGTKTYTLPFTYDKGDKTLTIDLSSAKDDLYLISSSVTLTRTEVQAPKSMTGTRWTLEFAEDIEGWYNEQPTTIHAHYKYTVDFTTDSKATFRWAYSEEGDPDEDESMAWDFDYRYADGVGDLTIRIEGDQADGGFYMPDANHIAFIFGEAYIAMVKE